METPKSDDKTVVNEFNHRVSECFFLSRELNCQLSEGDLNLATPSGAPVGDQDFYVSHMND